MADVGHTYDLLGSLKRKTYPSGRVVTTGYDQAERTYSVSGSLNGTVSNYVSGVSYAPHGGFAAYTMGNQVQRTFGYTSRLEMASVQDSLNGGTLLQLTNAWRDVRGLGNNGNVYSQTTIGGGLTLNQQFTYDAVNRLSTAQEGNHWLRRFGYDAFGNMYVSQAAGMPLSPFTPVSASWFDSGNRLSNPALGVAYDQGATGPGNLTAIGGYTFAYDAENRQTSAAINGITTSYRYDGEGRRVQKIQGGQTINYAYDALGGLAAEYRAQAETSPCATCYLSFDHLGSTRLVTNEQGQIVARHDYLPFGEEITGVGGRTSLWGGTDAVNQRFTGKERDTETQLDFFQARYFSAAQQRFLSPDPFNTGADPTNPQSWNAYAYVNNNPLNATDPLGLAAQSVGGGCTWDPDTNTLFCGGTGVTGCVSQGTQGCIRPPCVTLGSNCGESGSSGLPNGGGGVGGGIVAGDGQDGVTGHDEVPPKTGTTNPCTVSPTTPYGPCIPPDAYDPLLNWLKGRNWNRAGMYAACIAGVEPGYMTKMGTLQVQDAPDSLPETQGARQVQNGRASTNVYFGPGKGFKNGGQAPINPNGDSPTPGNIADGVNYFSNVVQCIANVNNNF